MIKPTILILPYTPTLSHISRPLEIAKKLRNQGCSVIFAGDNTPKSKRFFIQDEGFEVETLYEPDPDELFGNIRKGKLCFVTKAILERMIQEDRDLFDRIKPDLVLTDGRFSAMISTQLEKVPHAAIVNASSTEYRSIPYIPMFDLPVFDLIPFKSFHNCLDSINLKIEMTVFDNAMSEFKRLSRQYQLPIKVTATNCLAGTDLTFLADLPEYFPVKNKPDHYHYIGPITWKQSKIVPMPDWWDDIKRIRKPKIYITMGTTGENNLFNTLYDLFNTSEFISIVTTGSQAEGFTTIPDSIYVENYLDGEKIIETCDLVVCHGGNGTIYQALSLGKPVLGIPTIPDQDYNMRRVEALGTGLRIPMKKAVKNPLIIKEKAAYILNNMALFKPGLAPLKARLKEFNGAGTASDMIMRFLKNQA